MVELVSGIDAWSSENNLVLTNTLKKLGVNIQRNATAPLVIGMVYVEWVDKIKLLNTCFAEDLS